MEDQLVDDAPVDELLVPPQEESQEVITPVEEVTEPVMSENEKALMEEVSKYKGEAEKYKTDYTNFQKTHQKAIEEGRITKSVEDMMNSLQSRFDELEMNQAILLDRPTQMTEYDLGTQPKDVNVDKLRQERDQRQRKETEADNMQKGINAFMKGIKLAGLDWEDPEIKKDFALYPTPWEALDALPEYVAKITDQKQLEVDATQKQKEEIAQKEAERKVAEQNGELDQPALAGNTSTANNDESFLQIYSEGNSNDHARAKKLLKI